MVADGRLVPAVSTLLDPRQWQIRAYAIEAFTKIDTEEAAIASGRISRKKQTCPASCDSSRSSAATDSRTATPRHRAPFAGGPPR